MSDPPNRLSSPSLSSSPGRPPSAISTSRPHWPWASSQPSISNNLLRYNHQRSSTSNSSVTSTSSHQWQTASSTSSVVTAPGLSWQNSSSSTGSQRLNTGSTTNYNPTTMQDVSSARQWSFLGFEWLVRDVHKLRDFIEADQTADGQSQTLELEQNDVGEFEILSQSPILGENRFKLEVARTPNEAGGSSASLSLYITSLALDFAHPDYEMSAVIMAGIKCQDERAGERGARPDWAWEHWQHDWVFRQESEVWTCPLPSVTELLRNPRIAESDSFVIAVQLHSPIGPFFPSHPTAYYVPKDLLDGLEASLDNSNTGDVRFICLERVPDAGPSTPSSDVPSPTTFRSPSTSSSHSHLPTGMNSLSSSHSGHFPSLSMARKRVIYAHSDILIRRSDYFATMLESGFAENTVAAPLGQDRKLYTIVVEEADFETIYWLLKYCYANWLLFKELDDPRTAVQGLGTGWSVKWLQNALGNEWDWQSLDRNASMIHDTVNLETRSAASGESLLDADRSRSPLAAVTETKLTSQASSSKTLPGPRTVDTTRSTAKGPSTTRAIHPQSISSTSAARRTVSMSSSSMRPGPSVNRPNPLSTTPFVPHGGGYPISPRNTRPPQPAANQIISSPDPHAHPTPAPSPASALSMYHVAHRYGMPALGALALEHIVNTMTPHSSFALLLASSAWDDLKVLVEDFIVEKWDEVSSSEEFERCCEEVAAGEWGPDGGKTMMALFRRLRSPAYPRT